MPGVTKRLRNVLVLALLAAGAGGAWAGKLDKTACNDLDTELAGLLPSVKDDMARGPEWAAANLGTERLQSINRVIELQGQLQFRCGSARRRNVAKSTPDKGSTAKSRKETTEDPKKADDKASPRRRKKSSQVTVSETAPAAPVEPAPKTSPAPASAPPKVMPVVTKTATVAPEDAKADPVTSSPPSAQVEKPPPATPPGAGVSAPPPAADPAAAAAPKKTAARKKARRTARGYVSPKEANPFSFLTGP